MTELDLTPREPWSPPGTARRWPSLRNAVLLGVIAVALGFVLYQALTSARVYFYNVDEAVERQAELGGAHFRMHGAVSSTGGTDPSGAMLFTLGHNGASAEVRHLGDEPSGLFELGQDVVVEGHWEEGVFVSRQILVKHSEAYVEANPGRFEADGSVPAATAGDGTSTGG